MTATNNVLETVDLNSKDSAGHRHQDHGSLDKDESTASSISSVMRNNKEGTTTNRLVTPVPAVATTNEVRGRRAGQQQRTQQQSLSELHFEIQVDDDDVEDTTDVCTTKRKKGGTVGSSARKKSVFGNDLVLDNRTNDDDDDDENARPTAKDRLSKSRYRQSLLAAGVAGVAPMTDNDDNANDDTTSGSNNNDEENDPTKQAEMASKIRRRRRSSARFLRFSNKLDDVNDGAGDAGGGVGNNGRLKSSAELSKMYHQVIRMHAENKINSHNSWGLNLIENLDKLIADDTIGAVGGDAAASNSTTTQQQSRSKNQGGAANAPQQGYNFTKASCTLDASTKIYSYRVDDVHLTSFRVLANLNRTDNNGSKKATGTAHSNDNDNDGGDASASSAGRGSNNRKTVATLENNVSNINMSQLESSYDIDPLFHKVSKTFDEGGAKGLLLANLCVATHGNLRVVFDSKEDNTPFLRGASKNSSAIDVQSSKTRSHNNARQVRQQQVNNDLASLTTKLDSLLDGMSVQDVPLAPQLPSLRNDFRTLEAEGFVSKVVPKPKSYLYAPPVEEEQEAEKSIHYEALERSRMSSATGTRHSSIGAFGVDRSQGSGGSFEDNSGDDFGGFGGGTFDDGDDDDDDGFNTYMELEDCAEKYASNSFVRDSTGGAAAAIGGATSDTTTPPFSQSAQNTVTMLDFMSSDAYAAGSTNIESGAGGAPTSSDMYSYFNEGALARIMSNHNAWAGSAHWKRCPTTKRRKKEMEEAEAKAMESANDEELGAAKKSSTRKKKATNVLVNLSKEMLEELDSDELYAPPKKSKRTKNDPLELSDAILRRNRRTDNTLPLDAGVTMHDLTNLFCRPKARLIVQQTSSSSSPSQIAATTEAPAPRSKVVNFVEDNMDDMYFPGGSTDDHNPPYNHNDDDDDDGPGFQFAGGDDDDDDYYGGDDTANVDDGFAVKKLNGIRKVNKVRVGYATVAKKVDVKRLKKDLWEELELRFRKDDGTTTTSLSIDVNTPAEEPSNNGEEATVIPSCVSTEDNENDEEEAKTKENTLLSFQQIVHDLDDQQTQQDVTLPFYFICVLHLANEKNLKLEPMGNDLRDFIVRSDNNKGGSSILLIDDDDNNNKAIDIVRERTKRSTTTKKNATNYHEEESDSDDNGNEEGGSIDSSDDDSA